MSSTGTSAANNQGQTSPIFFAGNKIANYEQILTGAHRNPTPRARPPFVISHLGFWQPLNITSPLRAGIERNRRKFAIDAYLQSVWKTLKRRPGQILHDMSPNLVGDDVLLLTSYLDGNGDPHAFGEPGSRHRSAGVQLVTFVFEWHGARATIRLEKRTEYVTLTFIVDFSPFKTEEEKQSLLNDENSCLCNAYQRLIDLEAAIQAGADHETGAYNEIHQCLYSEIWDRFYGDVLQPSQSLQSDLGEIFADFRGLVLGRPRGHQYQSFAFHPAFWRKFGENPSPPENAEINSEKSADESGAKADVQAPDAQLDTTSKRLYQPFDANDVLNKFWKLLTVEVGGVDFRRYEFTACRTLGGRALYVSTLGARRPDAPESERLPIHYLMYSDARGGWQMGRLVERIHNLGCERLAALVAFDQLRSAGYELRGIEEEIQSARQAFLRRDAKIDTSSRDAEMKLRELAKDLSKQLRVIEVRIRRINRGFNRDIEYRIERSQYYIRQFRSGLEALRIRRIEGYQPYDEFVERRLGPAFSLIDALRAQYERVTADVATLVQYRIAVQGRAVLVAAYNRNREIETLQDFGDLALWLFLIPYYAGSLFLTHATGQEDCLRTTQHHWQYLWLGLALIGLGYNLYRRLSARRVRAFGWLTTGLWIALCITAGVWMYFDWHSSSHMGDARNAAHCRALREGEAAQIAPPPKAEPRPQPSHKK